MKRLLPIGIAAALGVAGAAWAAGAAHEQGSRDGCPGMQGQHDGGIHGEGPAMAHRDGMGMVKGPHGMHGRHSGHDTHGPGQPRQDRTPEAPKQRQ